MPLPGDVRCKATVFCMRSCSYTNVKVIAMPYSCIRTLYHFLLYALVAIQKSGTANFYCLFYDIWTGRQCSRCVSRCFINSFISFAGPFAHQHCACRTLLMIPFYLNTKNNASCLFFLIMLSVCKSFTVFG